MSRPVSGRTRPVLTAVQAAREAERFALLADPVRVRLLHALASSASGTPVEDLAAAVGLDGSECARQVGLLRGAGLVLVEGSDATGTARVDPTGRTQLPVALDLVLGTAAVPAYRLEDLPADVATRTVRAADMPHVLAVYEEGIATRQATFETVVPSAEELQARWRPGLAWVAEVDGAVVGWTAVTPVSGRACYAGVGETSVYVAASARGRGVGRALLHTQVTEAERAGAWTLQTAIFPENHASLALHRSAGYRSLAVRERIARLDGTWRDTVLLERRVSASRGAW
ncbi:phosphinothricin acetyltransferase [Nocardioides scoriae]|uniref:Phosphinothricin acetyltransferase n=1 Tax=Nocardioides scoriae TaxID=642780 RepID=A0A1H1PBZ5_9ACTN|nr:GNAT family N-acetyltransferase [Nocardioides scoriae]SDS08139.1 phosphinothricin acetyltransferase [Nocardioides scoriae]